MDALDKQDFDQDIRLKRTYGVAALVIVCTQLLLANVFFAMYGYAMNWRIPTPAISVWMGATVVQTIGVVAIISGYLFPSAGPQLRRRLRRE